MNENLDNKYSPENAEHTENAENRQYTDPNAGAEQNQYQGNYYYDAGPDPSISSPISSISRTISPDMIREWIRSR